MLETALANRNERLETEVLLLKDQVADLKRTLSSNIGFNAIGHLTGLERKVLEAIPLAPRYISRDGLYAAMYGDDINSAPLSKTVDVYMHRIRRLLRKSRAGFWVRTVWGEGFTMHRVSPDFWDKVPEDIPLRAYSRTPDEILARFSTQKAETPKSPNPIHKSSKSRANTNHRPQITT